MRISIIKKGAKATWEISALLEAARRQGCTAEVVDISRFEDRRHLHRTLGDVSIWRSAIASIEKAIMLTYASDKIILNHCLAQQPFAAYKLYQQSMIERHTALKTIPTSHFRSKKQVLAAVTERRLTYPFIQKPILGSRGFGISVIHRPHDLPRLAASPRKFIYQPFLPNRFDYRLLVVGGVMLGAIKRIRAPQASLNNIAQGAYAKAVRRESTLRRLRSIADIVAPLFSLHIFAVDVLPDMRDNSFYFLEINTVPQWQAFERTTGVAVAAKIVNLSRHLHYRRRGERPRAALVADYYLDNLDALPRAKQLHLLSRLYLWSGHPVARRALYQSPDQYVPTSTQALDKHIKRLLAQPSDQLHRQVKLYELRRAALQKYPHLKNINRLLELKLLSQTVFRRNITSALARRLPLAEQRKYQAALLKHPGDVAVLSSLAVNYLCLTAARVPAGFWETIARRCYDLSLYQQAMLQIYLITHVIINATRFYSAPLGAATSDCRRLLLLAEQSLLRHYHHLPLDVKLEWLVCAKLCGYVSHLSSVVLGEAENSLSPLGNYLVDTLNTSAPTNRSGFVKAEHASVLYIMASTEPSQEFAT